MKILENKLINKSELARLMWPDKKSGKVILAHKISGHQKQHFNDKDRKDAHRVLKNFAEELLIELQKKDFI